jgi:site-specific recombinase XerC
MLATPTAMRCTFAYLRAFLSWCVKRGYLEAAPTDRMEQPKGTDSRSRVLTPDELKAIWNAAPDSDYVWPHREALHALRTTTAAVGRHPSRVHSERLHHLARHHS